MKRITVLVLALVLMAVPGLLEAQQGAGRGGRGGGMFGLANQQNPIEAILVRRDSLQLGLSADQVSRLETLRDELTRQNQPHQQALQRLVEQLQGGGAPDPSIMQEFQTHAAPITEANQAAIQRARTEILTAEQWAKVENLPALQPPGRGGRRGGGGGPRGGGAGD